MNAPKACRASRSCEVALSRQARRFDKAAQTAKKLKAAALTDEGRAKQDAKRPAASSLRRRVLLIARFFRRTPAKLPRVGRTRSIFLRKMLRQRGFAAPPVYCALRSIRRAPAPAPCKTPGLFYIRQYRLERVFGSYALFFVKLIELLGKRNPARVLISEKNIIS